MFISHMPTKEESNDTEVVRQEKMAVSNFFNFFIIIII